jgi:hypothetical protein
MTIWMYNGGCIEMGSKIAGQPLQIIARILLVLSQRSRWLSDKSWSVGAHLINYPTPPPSKTRFFQAGQDDKLH